MDDEARWSVYVTSYQMLDPTEGVPHSRVARPFLKRNLAKHVDVDTILSEDRQELRIDVSTYRILFTYIGAPGKPFVYEKKISKNEAAYIEEAMRKAKAKRDEKMMDKFVTHAAWMKDESAEEIERTNAAWQKGLQDGLWKMEEDVTGGSTSAVAGGDVMAVDVGM
jgi:paired amphipathic helix protein Sin3a